MMNAWRAHFPIFNHHPLIYLDNTATTQKPQSVIDAISNFYTHHNANVHRGIYTLGEQATVLYESARKRVADFIHAPEKESIIFVRGTTEAINLVAHSYGATHFKENDEIIISLLEHHANIVPWQRLCELTGCRLRVIPITKEGDLDLEAYQQLLSEKTKLVSVTYVSNVLGTVNPVKKIIAMAHEKNIPVLLDGAQAVPHFPVDVQALDCDFFVFSSHKMYGPTGIGVLYAKSELLNQMAPYQTGGNMIERVSFEKTTYREAPYCFEAGTPAIAEAVGLQAAIDFIDNIGFDLIERHEKKLLQEIIDKLEKIPGLTVIGKPKERIGIISFVMDGIHPHDVATILDDNHIAIRAGHHCAMPLMDYYQIPGTVRVSIGLYNSSTDIDALVLGLESVLRIF